MRLIAGMSAYMPLSEEPVIMSAANKDTPVLICHGDQDQGVSAAVVLAALLSLSHLAFSLFTTTHLFSSGALQIRTAER